MMSEFRGREGVHEIRTLLIRGQLIKLGQGGGRGSKMTPKIRTSFMDAPLNSI